MKSSLWVIALILPGFLLIELGWADIYSDVAENGVITLAEMPADGETPGALAAEEGAGTAPVGKGMRASRAARFYAPIIDRIARDHGLESELLHAVIAVESRYDPSLVSPAGATGLMQLMPGTAKQYGVADLFDPEQNMQGGARYLRFLLDKFDRDTSLALAAYNAGENAVYRHGNRIPPYPETTEYVKRVLTIYRVKNDAQVVAQLNSPL